jgi:hypothetical protein
MQEEASISNADRPQRMIDVDGSAVDIFPLPVEEAALEALLRDLFENHWREITFGPIIEGAAYEFRAPTIMVTLVTSLGSIRRRTPSTAIAPTVTSNSTALASAARMVPRRRP